MLKRMAGLVMALLALAWLIFVWRSYVHDEAGAIQYAGWVFIFGLLWGYHILLRGRETPEAHSKARMIGAIIFIPVIAYLVQRVLGKDFKMVEMAAALSIYGLFLSWGWRLSRP